VNVNGTKPGQPATQIPTLVSRVARSPSDQYAVSRLILEVEPTSEYRSPPLLASSPATVRADPRLMRRLPWVPHVSSGGLRQLVEFLRPPAIMGLYSLMVLVIPVWLLRGVLRRNWTLPSLLLVPVAFAVAATGFKVVTGLEDHTALAVLHAPFVVQLLAAIPGIPVIAFPALLIAWTIRGHWARLAWLLGATVALSFLIPAIALWIDSRGMDSAEHYSWTGWYLILIMAGYGAASMTLVGMLLAQIVRTIRNLRSDGEAD
jgi:hypothetical protein